MQGEGPPAGMSPLPDIPVVQALPGVTGPKRLDFDVPYQLVAPIKATKQRAIALIASPETHMYIFEGFGKSQMKLWKSSPDGVVQMALQAAYFKLYGKLGPTYESCATRSFFHGRTEVIRSAHAEALSFSAGLFDDDLSKGDKEQLLRKALEWQGRLSKEASQAHGVDRHLLGLKKIAMGITSHSPPLASLVADSSKLPAMFHEAPFSYSQTWLLSTSNVTVSHVSSIPEHPRQ
jgi:carnitine O-acetyltransferase